MAAGMFDGVRELRSRLPDVPDTIIAHFLAKYNVEECYEKLKNGYDESADWSDLDTRLIYNSQSFEVAAGAGDRHTNAQSAQNQPWMHSQQSQPPLEMSPSHFLPSPNWNPADRDAGTGGGAGGERLPHTQLPYPQDDVMYDPKRLSKYNSEITELLTNQRQQLDYIRKILDLYTYDLTALRSDAENKRHALTALRIEVSEGPTILDTASQQDIISTLEYDIQTLQNKVQVEKTQAEMKQKLDVYTEEGVRWSCRKCGFLNHPLMSRCESCDQTQNN